ncbi:A disintegrin and metalloproteinase with thrombospondin motifs 16-like protein, partial [Dinothrombium tinctorium]
IENEKVSKTSRKRTTALNSPINRTFQKSRDEDNLTRKNEKYLELALFLGYSAYELLRENFHFNDDQIIDILLAYVSQIQAIYYQPSLGGRLHISLVRIEIHKSEQLNMVDGHVDKLLNSFCEYQQKINPKIDSDPEHWDVALYLTALNLYTFVNNEYNAVPMGLAPVGGVCTSNNNCIIAEFGSVNDSRYPHPSSGLMSTWVSAHELAHNLGILHDGLPLNNCPSNGFLMSSNRGTKGEIKWSICSSKLFNSLEASCLYDKPEVSRFDHRKFQFPGQYWDANDQCKFFLKDEDAQILNNSIYERICDNTIFCKSPNKIGHYSAGPALEGTFCGEEKWCINGRCQKWNDRSFIIKVVRGEWSQWIPQSSCKSGCLIGSFGYITERRKCNNPKPRNTDEYCEGEPIRSRLCVDNDACRGKIRENVNDYATKQCSLFRKYVENITENGVQISHNANKDWQSCAIYCKTTAGYWYTPRYELNDVEELDSFFPDGTLCHRDKWRNSYYCQRHRCLPLRKRHGKANAHVNNEELLHLNLNSYTESKEDFQDYYRLSDNEVKERQSLM